MQRFGAPGVVFAGCLVLLLRHPSGRPAWHTLWAEDGHVFVQCAIQHGIGCVGRPWEGYLHAVPRLLVLIVSALPVGAWAGAASVLALVVAAVALTVVWASTEWLMPVPSVRAVIVFVAAASAAVQRETAGNLANLHWFLVLAAVALAIDPQAGTSRAVVLGRGGWLVATCLSDPFGALVLAAFAAGALLRARRRGRRLRADLALGTALLVAVAIQVAVMATSPRLDAAGRIGVAGSLRLYVQLVLRDSWVGPRSGTSGIALTATLGSLAVIGAGLHHGDRRLNRSRVVAAAACLVASPVFWVGAVTVSHGAAPRYTTVPFVLALIGGTALMVETCAGWSLGWLAALGLGVGLLAAMVTIGPYPPLVSQGSRSWPAEVAAARARCRTGQDAAKLLDIAPAPQWAVRVSCHRLLSG